MAKDMLIYISGITDENRHDIGESFDAFISWLRAGVNELETDHGVRFELIPAHMTGKTDEEVEQVLKRFLKEALTARVQIATEHLIQAINQAREIKRRLEE